MTTKNARVSIIIPVYNAEKTIERAVKSALLQTAGEIEMIVIDDGSADGSAVVCGRLAAADPRIHFYQPFGTKGKGVSAARNFGLSKASGDFITFLDADDALAPAFVEALLQVHEKTGAPICGCQFASLLPEQMNAPEGWDASFDLNRIEVKEGAAIIAQGILQHDTRVWSKLFTREILTDAQFREGLSIGEDMLFVASLVKESTRYALLDAPLYAYMENPNGAMERPFVPSFMDQLRCWDLADETIRANLPDAAKDLQIQARLSAIKIISGTLTASKIVRQHADETYLTTCRTYVAAARKVPGAMQELPGDYKIKSFLLTRLPHCYKMLYRN